jgi:hypothetical protein
MKYKLVNEIYYKFTNKVQKFKDEKETKQWKNKMNLNFY